MTKNMRRIRRIANSIPEDLDSLGAPTLNTFPASGYAHRRARWYQCMKEAGELSDLLLEVKHLRKQAELLEDQIKSQFKNYRRATGQDVFNGQFSYTTITDGAKETMLKETVIAKLGANWWSKNVKITPYEAISTYRQEQVDLEESK